MSVGVGRFRGAHGPRGLPLGTALLALILILVAVIPDARILAQGLASRLVDPPQRALAAGVQGVAHLISTVSQAGKLSAQNQAYQEQINRLQELVTRNQQLDAENGQLRALLGLRQRVPAGSLVPAQVIARDPLALVQAVVVDRGGDDGIRLDFPVITDRGLVGSAIQILPTSTKVLLITDANSAVSVRTDGPDSHATGVVRGTGDGRLVLQYVAKDQTLKPGDAVTTSGVGGVYPAGITVGQVQQVRQADVDVFQEALVIPGVPMRDLEQVYFVVSPPAVAPTQTGG